MKKYSLIIVLLICCINLNAQHFPGSITVQVLQQGRPVPGATTTLLNARDSSFVQVTAADSLGKLQFSNLAAGEYLLKVSFATHEFIYPERVELTGQNPAPGAIIFVLPVVNHTLSEVTVKATKPAFKQLADRTIINIDAGVTNAGATVLEVLEKSPGVSVDRSGMIAIKGRTGVLVMIDNKPTYMDGAELVSLLESMNAGQAESIEIIDTPPASFDAGGAVGIINIKTKKSTKDGFNGQLNTAFGHGRYYKNNNSVLLNYRNGKWNYFMNYGMTANRNFMKLYALRTYFEADGKSPGSVLEQLSRITGSGFNHTLRAGTDYNLSDKTTVGMLLNGTLLNRKNPGNATATWLNDEGLADSIIHTNSLNHTRWRNAGINLNLRQRFRSNEELGVDVDYITYDTRNRQGFTNSLQTHGGYEEQIKGDLDGAINIYTAKADYIRSFENDFKWSIGAKFSYIHTNNMAAYFNLISDNWLPDYGKTNHFIYKERIQALYTSLDKRWHQVELKAGLRYEYTSYDGRQLGNAVVPDSNFTRNYHGLFPTMVLSWQADSANQFSITASRRIERPPFQKLNPFHVVINKYTYQQGNPYFRPQYTWNTGFGYSYNSLFNASVDFNHLKDYASQIIYSDSTGTIYYTEGNVGRMWNISLSLSGRKSLTSWWTVYGDFTLIQKNMETMLWRLYKAKFTQFNGGLTHQFRLKNGWAAEISGTYFSKSQQDIQEIVLPTSMLSAGVSKQVLKNKATINLTFRDMFYTQRMAGDTYFQLAHEYFHIKRDTRVINLSLTYRFGRQTKQQGIRSGGAGSELERVGVS